MLQQAASPFPTLEGHKTVNLTTFRKSGVAVVTPVWYVILDDRMYVRTGADAGKVKRLRNDPGVLLAPSTLRGKPLGPSFEARARVLDEEEGTLAAAALKALARRYRTIPLVNLLTPREERVVLEIVPGGA